MGGDFKHNINFVTMEGGMGPIQMLAGLGLIILLVFVFFVIVCVFVFFCLCVCIFLSFYFCLLSLHLPGEQCD